ncbi:hypothetical protein F4775DRAFT_577668 [Biscogniauxia sp. FL1348]|nr:hypothetical protein F4775DRAFT_577668 [Biscogniauxia sp. FL1348]
MSGSNSPSPPFSGRPPLLPSPFYTGSPMMQVSPSRPLRPLLPATESSSSSSGQDRASSVEPKVPGRPQQKRTTVPSACWNCRKKKTKCSAERPRCAYCTTRDLECVYDTIAAAETHTQALKRKFHEIQDEKSAYSDVYELLRNRPQAEAEDILQRIRGGADAQSVVRHVLYGDVLLQLSLTPETRFRYDFPYITEMPSFLTQNPNPYLDGSLIYENSFLQSYPSPPQSGSVVPSRFNTPYLTPYHAATIIDPRLQTVRPSRWTSISSDDIFMRKLLHDYFLYDWQWFPMVHKDYFLDDMKSGHQRFCSSLLVNALLAHASHIHPGIANRTEFWNPRNIGYQFLAEAKRLWEQESGENRLTTIQAGMIINAIYNVSGADSIGWAYSIQALALAHNMGMFDAELRTTSKKVHDAQVFTAWTMFLFQNHNGWYFLRPPLINDPPKVPLPDPVEHPEFYPEIWVRYPLNETLWPAHCGILFYANCQLSVYLNNYGRQCFGRDERLHSRKLRQDLYEQVTTWYSNLPEILTPRLVVLPSQLKLHMHYFNVIIYILGTEASREQASSAGYMTAGHVEDRTPAKILWDAQAALETVIRLYYLRHGFDFLDYWILQPIISLANLRQQYMREHRESPLIKAMRSTVILCAKGLKDQGQSVYLSQALFRLVRAGMFQEDRDILSRYAKDDELEEFKAQQAGRLRSVWPVNIVSVADDPEKTRLTKLIDELKGFQMDSESDEGPDTP